MIQSELIPQIHDSLTVVDKVFRGHVLRLYHCLKCHQVRKSSLLE